MRSGVVSSLIAGLMLAGPAAAQQPMAKAGKTYTFVGEMQRGFREVQGTLAATAEKMPEADYAFKPTPEVKPFGQLIVHVALMQYGMCARAKGEENPKKDEKETDARSRADIIGLLKASGDYCEPVVSAVSESTATQLIKMGDDEVARGLIPASLVLHGMQMYGTMAVYLRLKGIVPPTTERQQSMKKSE